MFKKWVIAVSAGMLSMMAMSQSVGLVLSGGGAKGIAHIGVIKALEEHQVPINYIGGTSMGAIVAGLYAMGMDPDTMIWLMKSEEFTSWLKGGIDEQYRYFFKSEYPGPDIFSIGIDLKDTIPKTRLPLSIIPNHIMDFEFMETFSRASAAANYDFDSLFIPFLCIGADISNSREVVFREGDLTQAVRASMNYPIYFRPILIEGNIMYDGGIYNNFPLNHVKSYFNPDVIIGSKAAQGNVPPDEFDILGHIENIVMKPTDYSIEPGEGILLDMDFKREPLLALDKVDEFVETGYLNAIQNMDSIKKLITVKGDTPADLNRKREAFIRSWPDLDFKDIEIEGLNEKQAGYVKKSIRKKEAVLGVEEVRKEYMKLASDKSLVYLYPKAVYDQNDSLFTLRLRVIPETPLETRFGLFISTTGHAQSYLGFSYRSISEVSTHLKGSIQFGRLYNGINLGLRFDYPSRIPLYFKGSFNYNGLDYNTSSATFFFEDLKPSYIVENEFNFRFDVGIPYTMNGVFKGGLGIGKNQDIYYMKKDFSSEDTSDISTLNLISLYAASEKNSLNNKQFSTGGSLRKFSLRAGYGAESYSPGSTSPRVLNQKLNYLWVTARFESKGYFPIKGSFSLGYHYMMQATIKPVLSTYFSTVIEAPVFRPTLITRGLFMEKYRAHQFIAAGIMPLYTFNNQIHAKLEVYGFFPFQEILADGNNDAYFGTYFNSMKTLFNASVNFITPAGPLGIHAGYITEEENPLVFQVSFGYLLFNEKSTDD